MLAAAPNASSETKLPFPRPAAIQPNVDFWVDVFTKYSENDFIIVDRDNVGRIYHVFKLPGDGQPSRADIEQRIGRRVRRHEKAVSRVGYAPRRSS